RCRSRRGSQSACRIKWEKSSPGAYVVLEADLNVLTGSSVSGKWQENVPWQSPSYHAHRFRNDFPTARKKYRIDESFETRFSSRGTTEGSLASRKIEIQITQKMNKTSENLLAS
uniref:Uncharacterized protein n=1 Tax=Anopheles atroparvus TaxID=41427 RepID=A0AAG5DQ50_ANOAO